MVDINFRYQKPSLKLFDFVESFWTITNHLEEAQPVINLPDGRIDILFYISADEPYRVTLLGLDSEPSQNIIEPKRIMCAVSFKLLAIEYVLRIGMSSFLNKEPICLPIFGTSLRMISPILITSVIKFLQK